MKNKIGILIIVFSTFLTGWDWPTPKSSPSAQNPPAQNSGETTFAQPQNKSPEKPADMTVNKPQPSSQQPVPQKTQPAIAPNTIPIIEDQTTNVLPPLPVVGVETTPTPSGKVEIHMFESPTPTPPPVAEEGGEASNKELAAPKISGAPEEPPKGEKGQKLNLGEMALKPTTAGQPTKFVVGKKNGKNECLVMIPTGVFDVTHCSPVSVMIQFQDCESGALGEKIEGLSRFVCKKKPMQLRFYYRHTLFVGTLKKTSNDKEKSKSFDVSKIDVFRFGVVDKTTGVIPGAVQNENIQKLPNAAEEVWPEDMTGDGLGPKPEASTSPSPSPSPRE